MKSIKIIIYVSLLTVASFPQNPHNWHYCGPLESPVNITALYLYGDSSILAATVRHELYISHNNGTTWDTLSRDLPFSDGVKHLEMVNGVLYAGILADQSGTGLWKSLDTGKTWEGTHYPAATAHGFTWFGDYIFASNSPVHRSADSGRTWESFVLPTNLPCMCLTHYGDTLYAGTYSGIFWSLDTGKTWVELIPGETTKYFTIDFLGEVLIAGTEVDIALSYNYGLNWNSVLYGRYECYTFEDTLLFARAGVHYNISTDTGQTWGEFKQFDSAGNQLPFWRIYTNENYFIVNNTEGIHRQKKVDSTGIKKVNLNKSKAHETIYLINSDRNRLDIFYNGNLNYVKIFSLNGKEIKILKISQSNNFLKIQPQIFSDGLYIVNILNSGKQYSRKMLLKK